MSHIQYPENFSKFLIGKKYPSLKAENSKTNAYAVLSLISQARHNIDLFTPDLDPRILNSKKIAQAITHFVKVSPNSRFRILVSDPSIAIKQGHQLIELARRFSSFISIRETNEEYRTTPFNLMMVDSKALIFRPHANEYQAIVDYNASYDCRRHLEFFNLVWERSESSTEMRQLFI